MGNYINEIDHVLLGDDYREKCENLKRAGGKQTSGKYFEEDLVCVIDNGQDSIIVYISDEEEYEEFYRDDGRPKRWFILKDAETYTNT